MKIDLNFQMFHIQYFMMKIVKYLLYFIITRKITRNKIIVSTKKLLKL